MADLPIQKDDKKEVPLTLEQRVEIAERDIHELARGSNVQAALLESIVLAFDRVVQRYLVLTKVDEPKDPKKKDK